MLLYCRKQVEAFAWIKWGNEQGLDAEFEKRKKIKEEQAEKRRTKKLKELRNKTRPSMLSRLNGSKDHVHMFENRTARNNKPGYFYETCQCGKQVEYEEL